MVRDPSKDSHQYPSHEQQRSEDRGETAQHNASEVRIDSVSDDEAEALDRRTAELFPDEDPIFATKELLQISHIPDSERIVGRDTEITTVADRIGAATYGGDPENLLIQGRTGAGKSLVAKHVTRLTKWKTDRDDNGPSIGTAYIDCKNAKTEAKLGQVLGEVLNNPEKTQLTFPDHGLSPDTYFQRLWKVMDQLYDVIIIILDEIDKHRDDDGVLSRLSRAAEDEHTGCNIGLIVISNKSQWVKRLEQRTDSGFQEEKLVFPAYDEEQLTGIMEHRRDAFKDNVLTDGVIPLAAEYAAEEHGDARRALDILRNAGKLARDQNATHVREEHVYHAADYAEKDEVDNLVGDEPPQSLTTLYALALLSQYDSGNQVFSIDQIYRVYRGISDQMDHSTLSQRRVHDILEELAFYEIIRTQKDSGGWQRGQIAMHRLVYTPSVVEEVVCENYPSIAEVSDQITSNIFDYLHE
jgi:cell division control protein 6